MAVRRIANPQLSADVRVRTRLKLKDKRRSRRFKLFLVGEEEESLGRRLGSLRRWAS
jgi:hypothetical protein